MNALFSAGFVVDELSEGQVSERIKEKSVAQFIRLSTQPHFMFVRARKVLHLK